MRQPGPISRMLAEAVLAIAAGIWLLGCDTAIDWVVEGEGDHGTVYRCESGAMCLSETGEPTTEEWCWDGPKAELERLLGAECHRIRLDERLWPALVGCSYCCDGDCGRGANAHCGRFCEAP